ncbi:MAG: LysE family translocator [Candidatus Accumulibacter sp.]|nr:LysE family translocator [Candidatus Accumulibacter necessarius]
MHLDLWLAFIAAAMVLLAIPGPTILTVISYSASHGKRATLPLIAGVALGDSTALFLSLVGLGALLAASALWFNVVKGAGGLYLLYLGFKMLRAGTSGQAAVTPPAPESMLRLFLNTYAVTALNPKGIVFFIAFLPQFLNPTAPAAPQLWVLGTTFVVLAAINATLYATFASAARRMLESPRAQRRFNLLGGSLICAAGAWALLAKRQPQ